MRIEIILTDDQHVGPDGWRHVEATGFADTETEARRAAQAVKEMFVLKDAKRQVRERVPFEYRETGTGRWHLFGRFSFK